jgi:hypothetical protein
MLHELTAPILILHKIFPQGDASDSQLTGYSELNDSRPSMRFLLRKNVQPKVSL